jgi:sulfide:quinone oxidoreductase
VTEGRFKVLIAGAGVAGLEALLALRDLAADRVDVTLLAPTESFVYRPLLVAEPFGVATRTRIELDQIVADTDARHIRDSLAAVEPRDRLVTTGAGAKLPYDALLIALGARPVDVIPGATAFGTEESRREFAQLLGQLGHRGSKRLAFVVPRGATWSIAAYELALLTARERELRRLSGVELLVVTHEASPLQALGLAASQLVAVRLGEAGVKLHTSDVVDEFRGRALRLTSGDALEADHAVALPGLEVPELSGLPQRERGFIPTDVRMNVHGLERVWAAGDATAFPIKQGGLAAQQAEVAARSIAVQAGARIPVQPFQPVLRAALLTGGPPDYARASIAGDEPTQTSVGRALWWPPAKLAGERLAPYLSRLRDADESTGDALIDLTPSEEPDADSAEYAEAVSLILAAADADAVHGDTLSALRWLSVAERFNLVLPQEYVTRRSTWLRELDPGVEPSQAAARIEPSLRDAATAISDLQRRIGWLREIERRSGGQMRTELSHLDQGMEQLLALSRRTGNYPRTRGLAT